MHKPRRHNPVVIALYVNAAMLLAVLVALLSRGGGPSILTSDAFAAPATTMQPIAGGSGLYLMPAQFTERNWGCYLMDVDAQTLTAYQWFEGPKKLRLVAARSFRNDRRLQRFNTDNPDPEEVAKLVELEKSGRRDNPDARKPDENDAAPAPDGNP